MKFKYKVRYAETDQMGIVHHANYLLYLEQARIEWLDRKGINYSNLEKEGIMLPVYNIDISYKKPLTFGENFTVKVNTLGISGVKISFAYEILNSKNEISTTATVVLVFMSAETRRPMKCPNDLYKIINAQ